MLGFNVRPNVESREVQPGRACSLGFRAKNRTRSLHPEPSAVQTQRIPNPHVTRFLRYPFALFILGSPY